MAVKREIGGLSFADRKRNLDRVVELENPNGLGERIRFEVFKIEKVMKF